MNKTEQTKENPVFLKEGLPIAHGDCQCDCHRTKGVMHCVPCCYPTKEEQNDYERTDSLGRLIIE